MKALRYYGNRDISLDDVPEPQLRPGWIKIKNDWCGICGSGVRHQINLAGRSLSRQLDLHEYLIGPKNAPATKHIITGEQMPTVLGHEFSGTIVELGEGVDNFRPGQRCTEFPILGCRECGWCQRQISGMCASWGFLGYSGFGGGMSE
jgi:(R,R)-butanediol dehydrogenase / meso-butanediol dehydrogenase / diacetyl reductase